MSEMKPLYIINLLGYPEKGNHEKLDKHFQEFISKLKQENLIFDYGYQLKKVPNEYIYRRREGVIKKNE